MFTVTNNAKANTITENINYVAIIELRNYIVNMSKDKAPYSIIAVGETEDEVLETASTEWFLSSSIADGWYKVVAIDEITIA
jgi:hypothetical protein